MADLASLIAAIDQAIAGNSTGITSYKINGREITRMSLTELLAARARLVGEQARAQRGSMFAVARPQTP